MRFARLGLVAAVVASFCPSLEAQLTASGSQFWFQGTPGIEGTPENGDVFGDALATGDFNCDGYDDLAIGIPWEDITYDCDDDGTASSNECDEAGAVEIIYGSAQGLHASAGHADQLFDQSSPGVPGVPENGDHFGLAVARMRVPQPDACDDLAVGAPDENVDWFGVQRINAGAVYYFRGTPSGLVPDGMIVQGYDGVPDSPEDQDRFGAAISGGLDVYHEDDFTQCLGGRVPQGLAIAAPGEDILAEGTDEGTVIVVTAPCDPTNAGSGSLPSFLDCGPFGPSEPCYQYSPHSGGAGTALATSRDRYSFLAVGAPYYEDGGQVDLLLPPDPPFPTFGDIPCCHQGANGTPGESEPGDQMGRALAVGDFDGDDADDLAVGVPFEDVDANSVDEAGAVNLFYAGSSGLPHAGGAPDGRLFDQGDLSFDGAGVGDHFGETLAAGDFDDDGYDDLAVAAPDENLAAGNNAGVFHVLYGGQNGLSTSLQDQYFDLDHALLPGDAAASDYFGQAMGVGDFDDDGRDDLAVSAPGFHGDGDRFGGVYVLHGGLPGGYLDEAAFTGIPPSYAEAAGAVTIAVLREGNLTQPLDVQYTDIQATGTATAGSDYQIFGGTLHWDAGEGGAQSFNITLLNDPFDEGNETVVIRLVDVTPFPSFPHCDTPPDRTITIADDDEAGEIQFGFTQSAAAEGTTVSVIVQRSGGQAPAATVHYASADGTAKAGSDYVAISGELSFAANQTLHTLDVTLVGGSTGEPIELFSLVLSAPGGGAVLGTNTVHTIRIWDDDRLTVDGFESGNTTAGWIFTYPPEG